MKIKKDKVNANRVILEEIIPERVTRQGFRIAELEKRINFLTEVIENQTAEKEQLKFVLSEAIKLGVKDDRKAKPV